jgi:Signal peptidase, peptidase S26
VAGKDLGYPGTAPAARPRARTRRARFWRELAFLLLLAAGLTVGIKAWAVEAFRIPSGSMEDTLHVGDRVLVNKLVYRVRGIDRGDVIVFSGQGSWDPQPAAPSGPPPRRGAGPLPMAVRLAGMLPLAWACRRQSAHMVADQR